MSESCSEGGENGSLLEKQKGQIGFTFALHQGSLTWPNYLLLHFSNLEVYLMHKFRKNLASFK